MILNREKRIENYNNIFFNIWKREWDYNNPIGLCQKIAALNIKENYLSNYTNYADKILINNYLNKIGLNNITKKIYNIYDNAFDIYYDLDFLPENFILKCNHDSGSVKIIKNKNINKEICFSLNESKNKVYGIEKVETQYFNIKKRIFSEEYLGDNLTDYKFFCFNGNAFCCEVIYDRVMEVKNMYRYNLYDLDWNLLNEQYVITKVSRTGINYRGYKELEKPKLWEEMIEISSKISKGFPFVRVDLYCLNNKIYFGEMTFTPGALYPQPYNFDFEIILGNLFDKYL